MIMRCLVFNTIFLSHSFCFYRVTFATGHYPQNSWSVNRGFMIGNAVVYLFVGLVAVIGNTALVWTYCRLYYQAAFDELALNLVKIIGEIQFVPNLCIT